MHELRDAPEPALDELVARMSPVDLLLVEGFKRHPHPKIEVLPPGARQAAALSRRPAIVAVASDEPLPALGAAGCRSATPARSPRFILGHHRARLMAQLSDDCFAFGGALLGVDAALALIEERVTPVVETETVPLAAPPAAFWRAISSRR